MKKLMVLLGVMFALLVAALPMASAQDVTPEATATVTYTEAEVNSTFWVTNPANRHLSNVYVDLQSENGGQVTISALYTWRATRVSTKTANVAVVLAPQIVNERLTWNVVSITADGKPVSADIVAQVNAQLAATWRRYINNHIHAGHLTGVTITDDDITFTYATHV